MVSAGTRASLLWGLVGALAFLVLVQGYELVVGPGVDVWVRAVVALVVGVVSATATGAVRRRLVAIRRNESP